MKNKKIKSGIIIFNSKVLFSFFLVLNYSVFINPILAKIQRKGSAINIFLSKFAFWKIINKIKRNGKNNVIKCLLMEDLKISCLKFLIILTYIPYKHNKNGMNPIAFVQNHFV